MKYLLSLALVFICLSPVFAQDPNRDNYPTVGKPCPDFVLRNIRNFPKKQANLADFKGKWLVLDFWNVHCGACVASFPRVSAMQKEFGDEAQFMLVGIEDKESLIEPMYEKFRNREGLVMPYAFDSLLAKRWDVYTCPHVIILDDQGVVRAITSSYHREDMQGFLSGNPPHLDNPFLYDWEKDTHLSFDPNRLFLVNDNDGKDTSFLFRSLLTSFREDEQRDYFPESIVADSAKAMFQVLGAPLYNLYNYAYYGTSWPPDTSYMSKPILEIKDPSHFAYNSYNKFCYSLTLPAAKASRKRMQGILQRDLHSYFGYEARIEERKFPSWKLVATEEGKKKLKTRGGDQIIMGWTTHTLFEMRNNPFKEFVTNLQTALGFDNVLLDDETGITGNIDIRMECVDTDFNDIKRALHEKGLDLVPSEKTKKVLVIKDGLED